MTPLALYLVGTSSWFFAFGIHSVMFAWLVTMVLHESPRMVGVAQMCMLVPATVFMLVGGSLADHFGGRRLATVAQALAVLPPLGLALAVGASALTFGALVGYAIAMGLAQAFVTPARDALLNDVAQTGIQRTVMRATFVQFGAQILGFLTARYAESVGPVPIFALQIGALAFGAAALWRVRALHVPRGDDAHWLRDLFGSVVEGARTVLTSRQMRVVVVQNVAMGMCFMGSYIVTVPILVRDVYGGSATDLGLLNAVNSLGLLTTVVVLLRIGDVQRRRRALLAAQAVGALVLASVGAGFAFPVMVFLIYLWGMCGGVAMSMARTIMQEEAPPGQAGRVMSFFSFSLLGAGPLGALANGLLVSWVGPELALVVSAVVMMAVLGVVGVRIVAARGAQPEAT